jgi:leucyl aminopeptidase
LASDDVGAVVVAVAPAAERADGPEPRAGVVDAAALYRVDLAEMAAREGLSGAAGQSVTVSLPRPHSGASGEFPWSGLPPRVIMLGIGAGTPAELRAAGAELARVTTGLARAVCVAASGSGPDGVGAFAEGYLLAAYRRPRRARTGQARQAGSAGPGPRERREPDVAGGAARLDLLDGRADPEDLERALVRVRAAAETAWLARDLAGETPDVQSPEWFADRAVRVASREGLRSRVLGVRELRAAGLGGLLAVSDGSAREPRLVTVSYAPADLADAPHVVVVGGGTTYDTGGLAVLPRVEMTATTTHAAGAAAALAVVVGAARLGLPTRVTAVLPLVENGFGASALRAGDVVALASGRTVEVARPGEDARLAVADGLAYALRELAPDVLLDVVTLTGAATVALGPGRAALLTPDDDLAAALAAASDATGEEVWRLPLAEDYAASLRSSVADLRDGPASSPGAGAVTAALFLREASRISRPGRSVRWAHIDVTGHARRSAAAGVQPDGATGFGARLLLSLVESL